MNHNNIKVNIVTACNKVNELCKKMTQNNLLTTWTDTAWSQHKHLVFAAMKSQITQVRMKNRMKADDIEEAEKRLKNLKKMWWEDMETEWSKVRVGGPTVLTKNSVTGPQMDVETKELLKHYVEEGIIEK